MFHFYLWNEENRRYAIHEFRLWLERIEVLRRLGNQNLVARMWDAGDPEEMQRGGPYTNSLTTEQALQEIQEGRWYKVGELDAIEDFNDLEDAYRNACEHDWGGCNRLMTVEAHEALAATERRRELESAASQLAQSLQVAVDSMEFIDALHERIARIQQEQDDWNSGERQMEHWGACQAAGVGSEVFFDDRNYTNGEYNQGKGHLRDILEWLETNCPLLMAQWRERQLESVEDE
jgi:hypothetical protein